MPRDGSKRPGLALLAGLAAVAALVACRREEKPPVRTEPWPASASSSAVAARPATQSYEVSDGHVSIDLRADRRPVRAVLDRIEGTLEVDWRDPSKTRGQLRADLESLQLEPADPTLRAWALERLGLASGRTDAARFAELTLTGVAPEPSAGRKGKATAQVELTLHRFRVPLLIELAIDAGEPGAAQETLRVETRRPFVVSLAAHGLAHQPDGQGPAAAGRAPALAKEARVSARITAAAVSR